MQKRGKKNKQSSSRYMNEPNWINDSQKHILKASKHMRKVLKVTSHQEMQIEAITSYRFALSKLAVT